MAPPAVQNREYSTTPSVPADRYYLPAAFTRHSYLCRSLPNELWTEILHIYCGKSAVPTFRYNKLRDDLRKKNAGWMRLIDANPLFWYRVVVDRHSTVPGLQNHVDHIRSRAMDISIDLDHHSTLRHGPALCDGRKPRYRHARAMLVTIVQTSHLWRHVAIAATCVTYMRMILDIIRYAPAPQMLQLALCCHTYSEAEYGHEIFTDPPTIFAGHSPRLRKLQLVSAALPWTATAMFSSLTTLELTNTPMATWPTSAQVATLLATTQQLRSLLFKNFGVCEVEATPLESFCMPALTFLELVKSTGINSVLCMLRSAITPSLRRLTLRKFDGIDYLMLKQSLRSFPSVQELVIRATLCAEIRPKDLYTVFHNLPELRQLDIRRDSLTFMETLATDARLLPKLETLHVGDVDLATLRKFVMGRPDRRKLKISLQFMTCFTTPDSGADLATVTEIRQNVHLLDVYPII
ncbi:hypothetical protein B0H11DRAFT_1936817 [Mycena galericulata]|nr:hypothetical protein B0H11DRAFT_1936817 [Mycena galericulata]